jgi:hypothetical protein
MARPQSAIRGQPRWPRFLIAATSPGRRPHSIHGNVTFPASTRRRSKTCRDPFAASSMTAQSRYSSTSLPSLATQDRRCRNSRAAVTKPSHPIPVEQHARPSRLRSSALCQNVPDTPTRLIEPVDSSRHRVPKNVVLGNLGRHLRRDGRWTLARNRKGRGEMLFTSSCGERDPV